MQFLYSAIRPASFVQVALAIFLAIQLILPYAVQAEDGGGGTGSHLDLSSTNRDLSASSILSGQSVVIDVGGSQRTISSADMLTAAEQVAVSQVLASGLQSIQLNTGGAAIGGSFSLNSITAQSLSGLVVPTNVTAIQDFGQNNILNLSGNLVNSGTIYGISSNSQITNAIFQANNINNMLGGLITTILPQGGLSGYSGLNSSLNLTLTAINSIVNAGTISSSANLAMNAASLSNTGLISSAGSMALNITNQIQNINSGQILAQQAMNINTASIVNSGLMSSLSSSMTIANANGALDIINSGGSMQALLGELSANAQGALSISGGELSANKLILSAIGGDLDADVTALNGPLDVKGNTVHLQTQTGNMVLNSIDVSGDPIFANNGGDVILAASVNAGGGPLAAIASGCVCGAAAGTTITNATSIYLLSGAANSTGGGNTTVTGASGSNGSIQGITSISATGDVILGSYGGVISVGDITAGDSSNVGIYAPGDISVGNITTTRTTVNIINKNPDVGAGVTFNSSGGLTSGTISSSGSFGSGSIFVGNLISSGYNVFDNNQDAGSINIQTGGSISTGYLRTPGTGGSVGFHCCPLSNNPSGRGGHGGAITLLAANGNILVNGDVNASGGGGGGDDIGPGRNGGNGGAISISAGGWVTINGPLVTAGGGGGGAGGNPSYPTQGLGCCSSGGGGGSFYSAGLTNGNYFGIGTGGIDSGNCCGTAWGGNVESAGGAALRGAGGAGGARGTLNVTARSVSVTGTLASAYGAGGAYAGYGVWGNGNITITGPTTSSVQYAQNSDLSSSTKSVTAGIVLPSASYTGATVGISTVNTYSGSAELTITRGGSAVVIGNGTSVTPAEWIALIQVGMNGSQNLTLDSNGIATGGSFNISNANRPTGNFTGLVIPTSVTANLAGTGTTTVNGTTTINGVLQVTVESIFSSTSTTINNQMIYLTRGGLTSPTLTVSSGANLDFNCCGTITTNTLNLSGTIQAGPYCTETLTIQSQAGNGLTITGPGSGQGVILADGGLTLRATASNLTINNAIDFSGALTLRASAGSVIISDNSSLIGQTGSSSITDSNTLTWSIGTNAQLSGTSITAVFGTLTNNGSLTATSGNISITRSTGITISSPGNTGSVSSNSLITLTAASGAVSFTGNTINGTVTGQAGSGSFTLFDRDSALAVNNITASGAVSVGVAGALTINSGNTIQSTGNNVITITADTLDLAGNIQSTSGSVVIQPNSAVGISVGAASGSQTLDISSAELGRITTATLTVGTTSLGGGLNIEGAIDVTGSGAGKFNLTFNNGGNVTVNSGSNLTLSNKNLVINALDTVDIGANVSATTGNLTVSGNNLINLQNFTFSGANVYLTGGALASATTVTATQNAGTIQVTGAPGIVISGTGNFITSGTGANSIVFTATGAGTVTFNNSPTLTAGASGSVSFNAQSAGGGISFANSSPINIATASSVTFSATSLTFANGSGLNSPTTITMNSGGGANGLTITGPSGGSATLAVSSGNFTITPTAGQSVTFASSGGSNANINFSGGNLTMTASGAGQAAISANTTVYGSGTITINVNGGATFSNNGTLESAASGNSITIQSTTNFNLAGSGTIRQSNVAPGTTRFLAVTGTGRTITLNPSTNLVVDGGAIQVRTSNLTLGDNASLTASNVSSTLSIDSNSLNTALTITAPGGSQATLGTAGGSFTISSTTNQALNFNSSGGASVLNLNGPIVTTSSNASTTIGANLTVRSNNTIIMNVNGSTFANNGTVASNPTSTPGSVTIQSTGTLTMNPSGIIDVSQSGGGNGGVINITASNTLTFTGGGSFNASASGSGTDGGTINISGQNVSLSGGTLTLLADGQNTGNGGSISILASGNSADITIGASAINVSANSGSTSGNSGTVTLTAGRHLTVDTGSVSASALGSNGNGGTFNFTAANSSGGTLTINGTLSANGAGTGDGGSISLNVVHSSGSMAIIGSTTFNANAGSTQGNGGTITISAPSIPAFASPLTLNANASGTGNGGTVNVTAFQSSGDITTGAGAGQISINATGGSSGSASGNGGTVNLVAGRHLTANVSAISVAALGNNGDGGNISLTAGNATNGTLTINGTLSANGTGIGNGGTIGLNVINNNGSMVVSGSTTFNANAGTQGHGGTITVNVPTIPAFASAMTLNANGAGTGDGGTVSVTAFSNNGDIVTGGGSGQITINANGGSPGSASGNGGSITLTAGRHLTANISSISASALGNNGNGGTFNLTAANSTSGILTLNGTLSANGTGTGNGGTIGLNVVNSSGSLVVSGSTTFNANAGNVQGDGGSITISTPTIPAFGSVLALNANASGTGNGGTLSVTAFASSGDIVTGGGAGQITLNATGGSSGSASGNGGSIALSAGRHITVNGSITAGPQGNNGNGANLTFNAGMATTGYLQVSSGLTTDGIGSGSGGNITVGYNDTNPFIVGGTGSQSYINGNISANAPGAGNGGDITFVQNRNSSLNITCPSFNLI